MAKPIHSMIRVLDETRSVDFYRRAFRMRGGRPVRFRGLHAGLSARRRQRLRAGADHQSRPDRAIRAGRRYGHIAFVVEDLAAEHARFMAEGLAPNQIREFHRDGALMAKFFFVQDPDGYRIEVLQRHGRYR